MRTLDSREENIFLKAIKFTSGHERDSFLSQLCGDDKQLHNRVKNLLELHDSTDFILDEEAVKLENNDSSGQQFGNYKLVKKIGEGGMGIVYLAEQLQPVQRRVALKLIKLGMSTSNVIARFEAERQTLAMMEHPGITKVFDAGVAPSGQPYFVMELVSGKNIIEYCDDNRLRFEDRLGLFVKVCHAVQHAHQKGVIHRDLKPSNILVTLRDGKPMPKIIDFGIAKATTDRFSEQTPFTDVAMMLGTPEYMSPEQANYGASDLDTRSDVYSLGAVLYELCTGTTLLEGKELRQKNFHQMREIILTRKQVAPSTRLENLKESNGIVCRNRRVGFRSLIRMLRGELDCIIMKCLSRDRDRRYASAADLARELERYLAGDPIEAAAPSVLYRLTKFSKKNRAILFAASIVFFILSASLAFSISSVTRANKSAKRALIAELLSSRRLDEANKAWQSAEFEHSRARTAEAALISTQQYQKNQIALARAIARFNRRIIEESSELKQAELQNASPKLTLAISDWLRGELGDLANVVARSPTEEITKSSPLSSKVTESDSLLLNLILEEQRKAFGGTNVVVADTLDDLGERLLNSGKSQQAVNHLRESLLIRTEVEPNSDARLRTMVLLGKALAGQGKKIAAQSYLEAARRRLIESKNQDALLSIVLLELESL